MKLVPSKHSVSQIHLVVSFGGRQHQKAVSMLLIFDMYTNSSM